MNSHVYTQSNFKAIRTSFGMNGVIIRCEHLHLLSEFLRENQEIKPPDLLLTQWMCDYSTLM